MNCVGCGKRINKIKNWRAIKKNHPRMLDKVDSHGVISLTERQQVLYANMIHVSCYHNTKDQPKE